jgi:hypothetical protein
MAISYICRAKKKKVVYAYYTLNIQTKKTHHECFCGIPLLVICPKGHMCLSSIFLEKTERDVFIKKAFLSPTATLIMLSAGAERMR